MTKKITPQEVGRWFGLFLTIIGIVWIIFFLLTTKSFEQIGIGIVIVVLGIFVTILSRKYLK